MAYLHIVIKRASTPHEEGLIVLYIQVDIYAKTERHLKARAMEKEEEEETFMNIIISDVINQNSSIVDWSLVSN